MKREKTIFDVALDVVLVGMTVMALFGIWFLVNVRWWA